MQFNTIFSWIFQEIECCFCYTVSPEKVKTECLPKVRVYLISVSLGFLPRSLFL